jgi:hypothetical protein
LSNTSNNFFYSQTATGYLSGSQGVYSANGATNNTFFDCKNISGVKMDVNLTSGALNTTFMNCSYNLSKESVDSTSQLVKKAYYQAYANDTSGTSVVAQINATNSTNGLEFLASTNSNGITNITLVTDYVNSFGTRTYSSPYNITASNPSYTLSSQISHLFNSSNGNNLTDFFTFISNPVSASEAGATNALAPTTTAGGGVGCTSNSDCTGNEVCWKHACVKLFDVKIVDFTSPVPLGTFFDFTYYVKGMADINDDVQINFWIQNKEENISSGSDTIYLGSFEEKTEKAKIGHRANKNNEGRHESK